jgi:hypothetical protein
MTVLLSTKFYETTTSGWKDLSKIVFTSPNIDSPAPVGRRSHILPGGAIDLGLWYEDTLNMYRISDCQQPTVEAYDDCSGTIISGTCASGTTCFCMANSIKFELTEGECYDCRLTAWDDPTHSTVSNEIIAGDHCRVSAVALYYTGSDFKNPDSVTEIHPPVYNKIFKGDTSYMGTDYFYGDFGMLYRRFPETGVTGDVLFFKPMLHGLHAGISYGPHEFYIVLHYSYT